MWEVYSIDRVEIEYVYTFETDKGENNPLLITDVKGRRHGYRIGLDTLIVHAENYECHKCLNAIKRLMFINESVSIPPQEYYGNV